MLTVEITEKYVLYERGKHWRSTGGALADMISNTGSICSCGKTGSAIIVLTNDFVPISVW